MRWGDDGTVRDESLNTPITDKLIHMVANRNN